MKRFWVELTHDFRKACGALRSLWQWWRAASVWQRLISMVVVLIIILSYLTFVQHSTMLLVKRSQQLSYVKSSKVSQRNNTSNLSTLQQSDVSKHSKQVGNTKEHDPKSHLKRNQDFWKLPTGGSYPNLEGVSAGDIHVRVDVAKQLLHILVNKRNVYTMIVSTGMDGSTPIGDYAIRQRGEHFYNPQESMGGDYWVGFIGTVYLFHSVPTGLQFGDYLPKEAEKLGKPASHGCVRLSVADARWFYQHIPDGATVHIQ